MSLERWAEAVDAYKAIIRLAPGDAEAHYFLGCGLEKLGAPDDALEAYRQAIALDPDTADAHYNLGTLLLALNRPEEARAALIGALEIDPNLADAQNNLGTALRNLGQPEEARTAYRRCLEIDPGHVAAHGNLGNVHQEIGEFREAKACYLRALQIEPKFTQAYEYLAELETFTAPNELSKAMETLAADPSLSDGQTMHLSFALAKAYDDLGDHDQAFACLDRGNRIKRRSLDYDVADDEAYFERLAKAFGEAPRPKTSGPLDGPPRPIFVVGMPRSGTTLVEQILASHSQVHGAGELTLLPRLVARTEPGAAGLRRLADEYLSAVRELAPEHTHVVDKLPANFKHLGIIRRAMPGAAIVHCLRDPRDTCLSCYGKLFVNAQAFSYDLGDLGRYYRAYARLTAHWREAMPGCILDVRYEDVVGDLKGQTERLLEFCGLPWEEGCLSYHETRRPVHTASAVQVRQPIYAGSVGRWERYRAHLGPLLEALGPAGPRTAGS